jgi:hypothetical protein
MAIAITHSFTSPKADGADSTLVQPSNWNDTHDILMSTDALIGRTAGGTGAAQEITVGANLTLSGTVLNLNNNPTITTLTTTSNITMEGTGSIAVPVGTTAQRGTVLTGKFRFNSDLGVFEGYNGSAWAPVGQGAVGGEADKVFYENDKNVTVDYTITTGKNAMTAGPVTINTGISVTIPTGSVWTVV